jgi:arylsulfatase A-like enzyme
VRNPLTRRRFTSVLGAASAAAGLASCRRSRERPNILWITCEDIGPHLGAYGDRYATTPNLDKLASRSLLYRYAWSNGPVCAPARTAIISGMYPQSTGSEHMRSLTRLPAFARMYPQYLREAGYYASNNNKEDYNLEKPGVVWDDSSKNAHWRNRRQGQPFFAIFNFTTTHESQIRRRPHELRRNPAEVRLPEYHPDTPEVRHDWAQYYDNIATMDEQAGRVLGELQEDGLAEDTIVFFYGDHGSGMPRSKRWPYNSGCQVPLIVHVPEKYRRLAPPDYFPGGATDRLVSFVDLAPTVLSLAGIRPPAHMQGTAFMGEYTGPEPAYLHGFRGRMDERYDMVRSVRDKRYVYIRNYMPHRIYGQYIAYMFETPTTTVWKALYDQGKLTAAQRRFWETKPPEELYDLESDPDEVHNLAGSPEHKEILERLRKAQREFALEIRDTGFLPEAEIHSRSAGSSPYEMARDEQRYPLRRVLEAAEAASSLDEAQTPRLAAALNDPDSAVRHWAALGLLMRGEKAVKAHAEALRKALREDSSPYVRATAAEALGLHGGPEDVKPSLEVLIDLADLSKHGLFVALWALNSLDYLDERARPLKDRIAALPDHDPKMDNKFRAYAGNLIKKILADLG